MLLGAQPDRVSETLHALWVLLSWPMLVVGSALCLLNIYLSFVRYPLHLRRGGTRENYKWVSGVPIFGSLFVLGGLRAVSFSPVLLGAGLLLAVLDTGGLHWAAATLLFRWWRDRKAASPPGRANNLP